MLDGIQLKWVKPLVMATWSICLAISFKALVASKSMITS